MKALTVEYMTVAAPSTDPTTNRYIKVPVVRLDELEKFLDCISRHLASIQAVHAAPAVLVVAETVAATETGAEEDVPVTQDYVNALWNASVDAADDIRKLLSAVIEPEARC